VNGYIRSTRELNDRLEQYADESDRQTADLINGAMEYASGKAYRKALSDLRSIMLLASDGSMKSLLDFSLKDVQQWKGRSETMVTSWADRQEWFEAAEQALVDADVDCICDLPPAEIGRLAEAAERVWKDHSPATADVD
jgi:hypothetical protein